MTFGEWLYEQVERQDEVGKVARGLRMEKRMQPMDDTLQAWRKFLLGDGKIVTGKALRIAWKEYTEA